MLENKDKEASSLENTLGKVNEENTVEETTIKENVVKENTIKKTVVNKTTVEDQVKIENEEPVTEAIEVVKSKEKKVDVVKKKPIIDFAALNLEELTNLFKNLLNNEPIQKIKNDVASLKLNFNIKLKELINDKKTEFIAAGGNEIDFHFTTPIKNTFFGLYKDYRNKIQTYYNQKEKERKDNFIKKQALIEELKLLVSNSESSTMFNELKTIQEKWRAIGPVPFEKNDDTWQTFRFHEQKVYDFLHLRSDFRNLDFKHNLEEKIKMVNRAEELTQEPDNAKAFKELQILHRLWKEDIGPVAREFREEIWEKFSAATKTIHDKRQELFTELEAKWEENVPKKEVVIQKINELIAKDITSHNVWQNKIKELESLRDEFFKIGKVTKEKKDELWESLREATRSFNSKKNKFYKNIKGEQQENLDKKRALVEKAKALKDNEDYKVTSEIYKKIQAEWKTIGHVPRKFSDKIWKEFRGACNHFFDKMHSVQDEANKELMEVFNAKKEYLDKLKEELKDVEVVAIDKVKDYIKEWKEFGQVPQKMRFIESKFNRIIDKLFSKLDMDKNESIILRFKNNVDSYVEQNDTRKLNGETQFIRKKVDQVAKEIKLLENNLGFFKHVDQNNPMVKSVYKNIAKHESDLKIWKQKLKYINSVEY